MPLTTNNLLLNKFTYLLQRNYGINFNVDPVYHMMRALQLPRTSTERPFHNYHHKGTSNSSNHLHQEFNQPLQTLYEATNHL